MTSAGLAVVTVHAGLGTSGQLGTALVADGRLDCQLPSPRPVVEMSFKNHGCRMKGRHRIYLFQMNGVLGRERWGG